MDTKDFKEAVAKYIDYDHFLGTYKFDLVRKMASALGLMPSTIVHWAAGSNNQHDGVKQAVLIYIRKQTTGS